MPPKGSTTELEQRVRSKILRASEIEDPTRFLFFGVSGSGKTRLAASAPNVLLIDVNDKGTKSTRRDLNPNVYPVEFWGDMDDVYWYLQGGNHEFETWCLDGATSMQNLCMKFVLGDETSRDASRDPDMPTRAVWGKVGELMKTQITNFRNLPMHGVITALQRTRAVGEDDVDVESVVSPNVSPSIAAHLEAAVDVIGHLYRKEVLVRRKGDPEAKPVKVIRRQLLVGPNEHYITKDRTGVLGTIINQPNVTKMLETIEGGGTE